MRFAYKCKNCGTITWSNTTRTLSRLCLACRKNNTLVRYKKGDEK